MSGPRYARLADTRTKARTMTGAEQGSAVEQMKEILLTWAGPSSRPTVAGHCVNVGSHWPHC